MSEKEIQMAEALAADRVATDEHLRAKELKKAVDLETDRVATDEHLRARELKKAVDLEADRVAIDEHLRAKELKKAVDLETDKRVSGEESLDNLDEKIDKILRLFVEKFGDMTPEERNERIAALIDEYNDKYGKTPTR